MSLWKEIALKRIYFDIMISVNVHFPWENMALVFLILRKIYNMLFQSLVLANGKNRYNR